jgi:hypothetical protein
MAGADRKVVMFYYFRSPEGRHTLFQNVDTYACFGIHTHWTLFLLLYSLTIILHVSMRYAYNVLTISSLA